MCAVVSCSGKDPQDYSGYEIALFRRVGAGQERWPCTDRRPQCWALPGVCCCILLNPSRACLQVQPQLGWRESMLNWSCLDWDAAIKHLADNDGVCDVSCE